MGKYGKFVCKYGRAVGRYRVGLMHERGRMVPEDKGAARDLFKKACEDGYAPACLRLKELAKQTHGRGG
jgi:TPR repeat protein